MPSGLFRTSYSHNPALYSHFLTFRYLSHIMNHTQSCFTPDIKNGGFTVRGKARKEDLFTIPNILCYIRIILVPVFVYLYLNNHYLWSAIVVITATLTDMADGYIARHFNMITDWGKFIDPVADKLMQFSMLFVVILKYPRFLIVIIEYALKECILLIVGLFIYHKGYNLNGANMAGKVCSAVFDIVMLIFIFIPELPQTFALASVILVAVLLLMAFCSYLGEYRKLYREQIKTIKTQK